VHKSLQEAGVFCEIVQDKITTGGGSAPRTTLETTVIAVSSPQIEKMLQHLRWCQLPIIPRIEDGKILVDLRTVLAKHDTVLVKNFVSFTQSSETLN
jgi:seryl-tRNA(Sec) selenium transferase